MPTPTFITLAAVMVAVAIAAVVIPLLRRGDQSPMAAGSVMALLPLSVAVLYVTYSNWDWVPGTTAQPAQQSHNDQAASLAEVAERLEQRLQSSPEDVQGWLMLGRTYVVLSRYPDAVDAYAKARDLTSDQDVNALTGYAESLALTRGGVMDNEVADLFEKALQMSPDDSKGLWYGGLAAFERGRAEIARSRWQRLLDSNPPEQMVAVLREQIAAADAELGQAAGPLPANTTAVTDVAADAATAAATVEVDGLVVNVSLAPELAGEVNPAAPLFILARQAGAPGPPIAVVRRMAGELPVEIVLNDANSMMAGRVLSGFENVEIVARISLSGSPSAQAGDLSGSKMVASSGNATIVIDSVIGN